MKATVLVIALSALLTTSAGAQPQAPASLDNPAGSATTGRADKVNPSGSGTSTSGGRDANGDQGRDSMPETANRSKIPLDQQNKSAVGR